MPPPVTEQDLLADDACSSIAARLSQLEDLRLPAALLRSDPYPDAAAKEQHLHDLLRRDAAVFLERYGLLLSADELGSFEPLRGNFEVAFYFDQAQAAQQQQQEQQQEQPAANGHKQQQQQHLSATVKNRRLAFMRRLEQEGDYFSEQAMREREPLVWHEAIGRHEGHPAPAGPPAGDRGFAGSLLASYDEAQLRARLQQQMEEEEAAMSEHDSDSDEEVDAVKQQQQQRVEQPPIEQAVSARQQQQQPPRQPQPEGAAAQQPPQPPPPPAASVPPTFISTPAAASAARTQAARAAGAAGRASMVQQQQQPQPQQQQQQPPAAAAAAGGGAAVDMGPDAMSRRRHDFLLEMQHRFLDGLDVEHQDYAAIDADTCLDEDLASIQAQDAEDAYFDADSD